MWAVFGLIVHKLHSLQCACICSAILAIATAAKPLCFKHHGIAFTVRTTGAQIINSLKESRCCIEYDVYHLQKSEEAVTFATGYLTIFLSHITNIQLMREFLCYLTVGQCDGKSVLNYLISNITSANVKVLTHALAD